MRRWVQALTTAVAICMAAFPAAAQDWPNRPVRVVIPYPAGGPSDMATRITLDDYRKNLTRIVAELLRHGIVPVLMTEPRHSDQSPPNGLGENPNVRLEPFMAACREVAAEWRSEAKPLYCYYAGDHDPAGVGIEEELRAKLRRYSGRAFTWERLGVLEADFEEFGLLELPVKGYEDGSNARAAGFVAKHGRRCAEVDALPPDVLRARVRAAVERHVDWDVWAEQEEIQEAERRRLAGLVAGWREE